MEGYIQFTLNETTKTYNTIFNWLKKNNIDYWILNASKVELPAKNFIPPDDFGGFEYKEKYLLIFFIEETYAKQFQETWTYSYSIVLVRRRNYFTIEHESGLFNVWFKLNESMYTSRGIKFPKRQEITNWLKENKIKFKFDFHNRDVTAINFSKEEDKVLFLLAWSE